MHNSYIFLTPETYVLNLQSFFRFLQSKINTLCFYTKMFFRTPKPKYFFISISQIDMLMF